LPPSITHSSGCSIRRPRDTRFCSKSVATTAFSVEPSASPSGTFDPSFVTPRARIVALPAISIPPVNIATSSTSSSRRETNSASFSDVFSTSARLAALLLVPRVSMLSGTGSRLCA
jgi:hypothetical protein